MIDTERFIKGLRNLDRLSPLLGVEEVLLTVADQRDRLLPIVKEAAEMGCELQDPIYVPAETTPGRLVIDDWKKCGSCLSCRARTALAEGGVG